MRYYVALISILFFLISCKPCVYNIFCSSGTIFLYSKEYNAQDLDTLIIKKYTQGSSFKSLVDTVYLVGVGHKLTDSAHGEISITDGYDYKIYAPVINKTFSVYNINNEGKYEISEKYSCGKEPMIKGTGCTNNITSFYVDGVKVDSALLRLAK